MTHDFLKPQKIGGLDTNTQAGQRSPFASRPFARIPKPEMSPQDIQTMRERAARAGNPMAKALGIPEPTVQREELPEEEKQENLQMKANESVQQKQEQPDLQTLIRQRAARVDTPLQRMMKAQMAQAQSLKQQEEEKLQTKSELTVQREMMPGEEEENLQMQSEPTLQPQELPKEEEEENLQMQANESVQRQEMEEEEDLQMKPEPSLQLQEMEEEENLQMQSEPTLQREELPEEEEDKTLQMQSEDAIQLKCQDCEQEKVEVQPKLTIGAPGDKYEQEADRVAAQVVQRINAPATPPVSSPNGGGENKIQSKPAIPLLQQVPEPSEEIREQGREKMFRSQSEFDQRVSRQGVEASVPNVQGDFERTLNRAKGGGSPLDRAFRGKVEPEMGADFSGVKVHTDSEADRLSQSIQAKAFTTGEDIFFKKGEYEPGSKEGQELLAHELTHVVQQNSRTQSIQRQKRKINPIEQNLLDRLVKLGNAATREGAKGKEFKKVVDSFKKALEQRLKSLKVGESLPPEVKIVMYTLLLWSQDPGNKWGEGVWDSNDLQLSAPDYATISASQYKCNAYVAEVLYKTLGIIHKAHKSAEQKGKYYPYRAREWSNPKQKIPHFKIVKEPKMGDVWAIGSHIGVYLGKYENKLLYISARDLFLSRDFFGGSLQKIDGIQIKYGESGGVYRRYTPSAPQPKPPVRTTVGHMIIWFKVDSTTLRKDKEIDSEIHLAVAIKRAKQHLSQAGNGAKIELHGYASEEGSPSYNMKLSRNRAIRIKAVFSAAGIPESKIMIKPHGEDKSLPTRPLNRRVEVHFGVVAGNR
ncbi:DUF4157 domain-containing protein [Hydrocoleum sp. CS-953]|uniref:eCIS core domain-containing protein n=1 Tax=Hydrocoleum sp. CS-953 TaxID=1671698 RepID=UPI000B9B273F|nr:DUF4157 domain-containing protein [Hydrocoleum sp. CS-953]